MSTEPKKYGRSYTQRQLEFLKTYSGGFDRLLILNLGQDLHYVPAPEPLLAPRANGYWRLIWSSDDPRYGGPGAPNPLTEHGWHLPAESAWLFRTELGVAAAPQEGEHG